MRFSGFFGVLLSLSAATAAFAQSAASDGGADQGLRFATYQAPVGFAEEFRSLLGPQIVDQSTDWTPIDDADIAIFFLSNKDTEYQMTGFGKAAFRVLDSDNVISTINVSVPPENTQKILVVYVLMDKFEGVPMKTVSCTIARSLALKLGAKVDVTEDGTQTIKVSTVLSCES